MSLLSKLVLSGLLCASLSAHAGLFRMTVHSRANCANNESITWWKDHHHTWRIISYHASPYGGGHVIDTGWDYNWRVAAIHWGEGNPLKLWQVFGKHYDYSYSKVAPFEETYAIEWVLSQKLS
jgi:hypothetical protein